MYENESRICGNITHDLELKNAGETKYINFSVATNKFWKEEGELKEKVTFIPCVAFSKNAENIAKHFAKGSAIYIKGELKQSKWETPEGKKRQELKVLVNEYKFPVPKGKTQNK